MLKNMCYYLYRCLATELLLLRANGKPMIDAEIDPSDMVFVRKQSEVKDGEIVATSVRNKNTLKRYFVYIVNKQIGLHPENKTMKDSIVFECEIQGVAVRVIKNLT